MAFDIFPIVDKFIKSQQSIFGTFRNYKYISVALFMVDLIRGNMMPKVWGKITKSRNVLVHNYNRVPQIRNTCAKLSLK